MSVISSTSRKIFQKEWPMWSPSRISMLLRTLSVALLLNLVLISTLGLMLAGCSDIYFDRRETVALGADDHRDSNRVAQMIDPWPRDVGRRQIAFDGTRCKSRPSAT